MKDTWDYCAQRWLNTRRDGKWFAKDEGYIARLNDHLAGMKLAEINAATIADTREALLEGRAPGTVNRIMGVLRTVLNVSREEWGIETANPRIKRLKETERVRFITREEAAQLIDALPKRMKPMVQLALATGLRQANILTLEWSECDITRKHLAIPGSKMKNGEPFGAPLNEAAVSVLKKQKGKHPRWVFPVSHDGQTGPLRAINNAMWKRACAKAGITDFRFHDLRHTWASWHLQSGTHPHALRELGGWKDDAMVKRYSHLSGAHLAAAAENVGELCKPSSPPKTSRRNSRSARGKPQD